MGFRVKVEGIHVPWVLGFWGLASRANICLLDFTRFEFGIKGFGCRENLSTPTLSDSLQTDREGLLVSPLRGFKVNLRVQGPK